MTDYNWVANKLRDTVGTTGMDAPPFANAVREAELLCRRMARGELVEAPKPCRVCKCPTKPADFEPNHDYCVWCSGAEPYSEKPSNAQPSENERAHCERVADDMTRENTANYADILLRERADAARMAKSECEAAQKKLARVEYLLRQWRIQNPNRVPSGKCGTLFEFCCDDLEDALK